MNQLDVLNEIIESFSLKGDRLRSIDSKSIRGNCSVHIARLLEGARVGAIDADICSQLIVCLQDVCEIKMLGGICRKAGLLELAIRCYEKGFSIAKDKETKAELLNNLGQVYAYFGDLERAVSYYKRALKFFECAGDAVGLAHVQGNLGSAYRRARDWDKSISYCRRSMKAFKVLGDELGCAQMVGSLGRIYADMGEIDLAISYYERSLGDFQKLGDRRSEAWILNWLGKISAKARKWDRSFEYYSESLSIFEDLGHEPSMGIILSNMGRAYLESGDAARSRDYLERSLKILQKEMRPAYLNATAWAAANYGILAREHWKKANQTLFLQASGVDGNEQLELAAQHYSLAADRFSDLSVMVKSDIPDLRTISGVARFLSALSELQATNKHEEAMDQSEKAISALKEAAIGSKGTEKEKMDALEKILAGMKRIWSFGHIVERCGIPSSVLIQSIELLMSGVCFAGEVVVFIYDALGSMENSLKNEMGSLDELEQLSLAASSLRKAEKRFQAERSDLGDQSAIQVGNAAAIVERLVTSRKNPIKEGYSLIDDPLICQSYRDALLTLGWVLLENVLPAIDKTNFIFSWDESMNLVEMGPAGRSVPAFMPQAVSDNSQDLKEDQIIEELEVEPVGERLHELNRTCQTGKSIKMLFVKNPIASNDPIVDDISAHECSLVPAMTQVIRSPGFSGVTLQQAMGEKKSYWIDRFEPVNVTTSGKTGRGAAQSVDPGAQAATMEKSKTEKSASIMQSSDSPSSASSPKGHEEILHGAGLFTPSNAMIALKALAVVVIGLLAIDVILYLI